MALLQTDAIVLHVADYLESSRILRLATRDAGVQSVVARGARSSKKRFGSAVDLFAEGQAQILVKAGRDLHALQAFDVTRARPTLALDLDRFLAANALAESAQRLLHEEAAPVAFSTLLQAFDDIASVAPRDTTAAALGGLWRLVADVGFRPSLDQCAECHLPLDVGAEARFHVGVGGALCASCARLLPGGRLLPASARDALRAWLAGEPAILEHSAGRAHQRLLREFLAQHLPDGRPLKAFLLWERGYPSDPSGNT